MDSVGSVSWWRGEVVLLYLAVAVSRIAFGVMIIIFPSYLAGYSNISLAIALALYPVLESVSAVPIGAFCDTRGRRSQHNENQGLSKIGFIIDFKNALPR